MDLPENRKANIVRTLDFIVPSNISFSVTTLGLKKEEKLEYYQIDGKVKFILVYHIVILVIIRDALHIHLRFPC